MQKVKIEIVVFEDGVVAVSVDAPVKRVRCKSMTDDPGYETDVRTYEDAEEGILYDNLD